MTEIFSVANFRCTLYHSAGHFLILIGQKVWNNLSNSGMIYINALVSIVTQGLEERMVHMKAFRYL